MPFATGQSGNPAGHPLKSTHSFAQLLADHGHEPYIPGSPISKYRALSDLMWDALTTGRVVFGGLTHDLSAREWLDLIRMSMSFIDLPPPPPDPNPDLEPDPDSEPEPATPTSPIDPPHQQTDQSDQWNYWNH